MSESTEHDESGLPDLRLPVGLFFIVTGAILLVANFVAHPVEVGMPIDLYWGALLLVFGVLMAIFGWKASSTHKG